MKLEDILASSSDDDEDSLHPPRRKLVYKERINFVLPVQEFVERFRLNKMEVEYVVQNIGASIRHKTTRNCALSPTQQVLVALHWLGNGAQYHLTGDAHGIKKATVCRIVHRVVKQIERKLFRIHVAWPTNRTHIAPEFIQRGGFPCVGGCIDGTLIPIDAPNDDEAVYVDRHGNHSLNVCMVCGPEFKFYYVNAQWPGSAHDSRVLRNTSLSRDFENGWRPFPGAVLLGKLNTLIILILDKIIGKPLVL